MSEESQGPRRDWRERMRQVGKAAFIREEMQRLGFWSPDEERGNPAIAEALAELRIRTKELADLRAELARLDARIGDARDIPALLAEIRRQRIERVRAAREARRAERARAAEERRRQDRERRRRTLPFLGRGVSGGLSFEGGDPARVAALGLPPLQTAEEVAAAIGIRTEELAWLTYHRGAATIDHYHRFTIPKRGGGTRVISSPKRRLRTAQQWLLKAVLESLPVHEAAMAFRPGRSIVDNAAGHAGKAIVLRLDLEEFFPSITFRRVKGLFESFGYNEGIATLLGLIATESPRVAVRLAPTDDRRVLECGSLLPLSPEGACSLPNTASKATTPEGGSKQPPQKAIASSRTPNEPSTQHSSLGRYFVSLGERRLPQGACTSPAISNLLCRRLDARLSGAARAFGFAYTRYADDLVFSHADRAGPLAKLLALVRHVLTDEGFRVNEAKTRVMRPQHRQAVTGLVVNDQPAVSHADRRRFRAFLHRYETEGPATLSERLGKNARAYAAGYLAFLTMVSPDQAAKLRREHPWLTRE